QVTLCARQELEHASADARKLDSVIVPPFAHNASLFAWQTYPNIALHYFYILIFSLCSVNVGCGTAEERVLLTGLHAVADIYCECCKTTLGWKYVSASIYSYQHCRFLQNSNSFISQANILPCYPDFGMRP